jgi:hypothetical protein
VVPVKADSKIDKLRMEAIRKKNLSTRKMLFKKDNMLVNEVYYDGGDVAGSL